MTYKYASEADILNMALFGMTAKQWREKNSDKKGNIRDYANVAELVCLVNLENLIDSKLVNEYLDTSITTSEQDNYELKDCLEELKKHISKRDYNIFIDRWINGLTYKQLVKKYNLNFASSVKYVLDKTEKLFKKLVKEDEETNQCELCKHLYLFSKIEYPLYHRPPFR